MTRNHSLYREAQHISPGTISDSIEAVPCAPRHLPKAIKVCAIHIAFLLLAATLIAGKAVAEEDDSASKWYMEFNYSSDRWRFEEYDPDSEICAFPSCADFLVAGFGAGYSVTPNWSVEMRYRASDRATTDEETSNPRTPTSYRNETSTYTSLSYTVLEPSLVYRFAPEAKRSFHLRGGLQLFTISEGTFTSYTIYNDNNTIRNSDDLFTYERHSDNAIFYGAGVTFYLAPRWHIRAEYLLQDAGDLSGFSASAGFKF